MDPTTYLLRIQEATFNAWPALRQLMINGWLLRFTPGLGHRSNCIVPLYQAVNQPVNETPADAEITRMRLLQQIRYCENLYAREQLQTVFRISQAGVHSTPAGRYAATQPPDTPVVDALLAARGYQQHNLSKTLIAPLTTPLVTASIESSIKPSTELSTEPSTPVAKLLPIDQWLTIYCQLTGMNQPAKVLHQTILQGICGECAFTVVYQDNHPAACGMAVLDQDLVGLFDIFTAPGHRKRGLARAVVENLMNWAGGRQAELAYLHVDADNLSAQRLYHALGFSENHQFWYRIAP